MWDIPSPGEAFAEAGPATTFVIFGVSFALTIGLGIFASWRGRVYRRRLAQQAEQPLHDKIEEAARLSQLLSVVNGEIQAEFAVQLAETKRLQAEADNAVAVAALNEEALAAARSLVASEMAKIVDYSSRRDRVFQVLLAAGGAVIGILTTLLVQALSASGQT